EVRDHPERVSAFLEATVRGWLYAFNHIEETAQLIHQSYNPQGKSLDALLFEAHELKKLALVGDMPFGVIDLHKLERMEDALRLMGVNISRRPTEDFLWEEIRHGRTTLLTFTPTEKAFIEKTLVRAATTTNWAPIAFIDKGDVAPQGIGYDFWRLVVEKSGLTYKIQPFNRFSDELNAIREKTQDLIYSVGMSESLEKYALFTKPYASFPLVIATAKEEQFLPDATHLIGRKVAVGRNFTAARMMKATFPRIDYMEVTNVAQGLQAVSSGEAYAFVDIMPVVVHAINELGFLNLKISGDTGLTFDLRFMIRDDYPELVSIADKAIESIQPEVRRDILRRWINVQYQHGFDITAYIPYVAGISVVVMIVLGWMYQSKLQAQRANRAKSEFLAVMSHDLRTPLNAIMGFSDMMRHEMLGPLNNEQYITYAHDIHRSGKLLVSLINDILDLSKIEAGKYELDDHPLVIADLIQACCRQCSVMAKTSDITVQEIIETPMPRLRGDERVLIQVLNNLLSNAIKYSDPSSTVTISASVKADNRIELAVADQGHGMTPEEVHRALQPFEQANSAIARRHDGTGLGLHLCQSFMGLFKGGLRVDSAKGRGTTVTLTFPSQRTLL
ncbi:MAG: ATP-binding protein, partial [Rhodospirillales bacterium]